MTTTWEKGRQLKTLGNHTYTYNASGVRISKTVNGIAHTYTVEGIKILREEYEGHVLDFLYGVDGEIVGFTDNGTAYYYYKNLQGDVISITDKDGAILATYVYDAWGKVLACKGDTAIAALNPIRYRGYYYDAETELYYLNSRYYDPEVCRFINADDAIFIISPELKNNIYAYCNNCPLLNVDNTGMSSMALFSGMLVVEAAYTIAFQNLIRNIWNIWVIVALAIIMIAAIIAAFTIAEQIKQECKKAIEDDKRQKQKGTQTVYFLTRAPHKIEDVFYVGRTNNFEKRMAVHKRDKNKYSKGEFLPFIYKTGLKRWQARIYEQALISAFTMQALAEAAGIKGGSNRIRGLSIKKVQRIKRTLQRIQSLSYCEKENMLYELMGV